MFTIRPEHGEELKKIGEINDLAFKGPNEAKLVEAIRESTFFIPSLSLVAESSEGLIGHILFSLIMIETETRLLPTLGLAPMAVLPNFQNQGVGSALVREGLSRAEQQGFKHVFVLGHPNFYPKFGFKPSRPMGVEAPFSVPDDVFMAYEIKKNSLDGIQGKVKYPPAFDVV